MSLTVDRKVRESPLFEHEKSAIKIEKIDDSEVTLASGSDHVRTSDVSRKRSRNQYDFVSNQKEVNLTRISAFLRKIYSFSGKLQSRFYWLFRYSYSEMLF